MRRARHPRTVRPAAPRAGARRFPARSARRGAGDRARPAPVSLIAPRPKRATAPPRRSAAIRAGTSGPCRNTRSTAPCARAFSAAMSELSPKTGTNWMPASSSPSRAGRSGPPAVAAAIRRRVAPPRPAAGIRPITTPEPRAAKVGTQWAASNCARGSPTSQASAASPGMSMAVVPSGLTRASNWFAAVTPSAPPTASRRRGAPVPRPGASRGASQSAQRSVSPLSGPATSIVAPCASGSGGGAAAQARAGSAPASRPSTCRRPSRPDGAAASRAALGRRPGPGLLMPAQES